MGGGSKSIAKMDTSEVFGLQVGTSCYGKPVPILYGRNRLAGNIIWMPSELWEKVVGSGASAGKGGGGADTGTPDAYFQAMMIGLCEGPVLSIGAIWRDKDYYASAADFVEQGGGPLTQLFGGRPQEVWDFLVPGTSTVKSVGQMLQVPIDAPNALTINDPGYAGLVPPAAPDPRFHAAATDVCIYALYGEWVPVYPLATAQRLGFGLYFVETVIPGVGATFTFSPDVAGRPVQIVYYTTGRQTNVGYELAYSGTAIVASSRLALGNSNAMKNFSFEVSGLLDEALVGSLSCPSGGASPASVVFDFLTNTDYGCGWSPVRVEVERGQDGLEQSGYRAYCAAMGFLVSPLISEQRPALEHVLEILKATNSEMLWSDGKLKIIPMGDVTVGAFIPYTQPIYDILPAHLQSLSGDQVDSVASGPITIERVRQSDTYNDWPVEYVQRLAAEPSNGYNINVASGIDQADVERTGETRSHEAEALHCILDAPQAQVIAKLLAQRSCYVRNRYTIKLGLQFGLLEAFDIVTLTDAKLEFDRLPVRIRTIEENPVTQEITVVAEDCLIGVAQAAAHTTDHGEGGGQNFGASPFSANPPLIFAPPLAATGAGTPELWIGVSGRVKDWGGAQVYLSWDDGNSYVYQGEVRGAVYGVTTEQLLSGPLVDYAHTLAVDVRPSHGVINSVNQSDLDALSAVCWVDGEIIAYQNAALQGDGTYHLSGLFRGCRSTLPSGHLAGVPFIMLNENLLRVPLDLSRYGQTVRVKVVSFNLSKSVVQSLSEVPSYPYTLPSVKTVTPVANTLPFKLSFDTLDRNDWDILVGASTAAVSLVVGGVDGGQSLEVTGDFVAVHKTLIPVNTTRPYGVSATFRQVANPLSGTKNFVVGFVGIGADGVTPVNTFGSPDMYQDQHLCTPGVANPGVWHAVEGYWRGRAATGQTGGTAAAPSAFHQDVCYVRLLIAFNRVDGDGTQDLDSVDVFDATAEVSAASSGSAGAAAIAAQQAAQAASDAAAAAAAQAAAMSAVLAEISSDNKLTPSEKGAAAREFFTLLSGQGGLDAQAVAWGLTSSQATYDAAIDGLKTYMLSIGLSSTANDAAVAAWCSSTTDISGSAFRSAFNTVLTARRLLEEGIVAATKQVMDDQLVSVAEALRVAAAADATAGAASSAASAAQSQANAAVASIGDIAADNKLTPAEKGAVTRDFYGLMSEQDGIDAQATAFGISHVGYDAVLGALNSFMNGLGINKTSSDATVAAWCATTTTVVGMDMRSTFNLAYSTRQTLLNAIAQKAKDLADAAQSAANAAANAAGRAHTFYATVAERIASEAAGSHGGQVLQPGDLWFDTDQHYAPWRWLGSSWATVHDVSPIIAAQITSGLITTDMLNANTIRTLDYAEDAQGNPTAGAKLYANTTLVGRGSVPAAKFSPAGIQIGKGKLSESWLNQGRIIACRITSSGNGATILDSCIGVPGVNNNGWTNGTASSAGLIYVPTGIPGVPFVATGSGRLYTYNYPIYIVPSNVNTTDGSGIAAFRVMHSNWTLYEGEITAGAAWELNVIIACGGSTF